MTDLLRVLIERWREDSGSTYRTWFLWDERLKNFRSIRRGIAQVVEEIEAGTFGNVYKGSSLETIVGSIAEQRQIFKGADHAFLWKPKLRIPDIYEDAANQRAFGRLLHHCCCCDTEQELVDGIETIDRLAIKGLGPAVANLLYFLHPTLMPPFNTAIVNGFNTVTGSKVKLGRWDQYLAMRQGVLELNRSYRDLLSNDLGAIAGFLFDVGTERSWRRCARDLGEAVAPARSGRPRQPSPGDRAANNGELHGPGRSEQHEPDLRRPALQLRLLPPRHVGPNSVRRRVRFRACRCSRSRRPLAASSGSRDAISRLISRPGRRIVARLCQGRYTASSCECRRS